MTMKRTLTVILGLAALIARAEDGASAEQASSSSTAPAYIRGEQSQAPKEAVAPVLEAIPGKLNADFAEKVGQSDPEKKVEITPADLVIQREQKNWLAVGVQKLSGDYKISENLTEEDREELAEKRASLYSPTLFIDHQARLNRTRESEAQHDLRWNDGFKDPILDQPLNFSAGWKDDPVIPVSTPSEPRRNPYLQNLGLETGSAYEVKLAEPTPQLPDYRPTAMMDVTRETPFKPATISSSSPISDTLAPVLTPVTAPQPTPTSSPLREKQELNDKYFKNLDRF